MLATLFVVLVGVAVFANAALYPRNVEYGQFMWQQYKQEYGLKFAESEDSTRLGFFLQNLLTADQRNADEKKFGGSAVHGITKFFHMSDNEFRQHYLMPNGMPQLNFTSEWKPTAPMVGSAKDWEHTYTTPVKDQGYCGSCWAFSAAEQIESEAMRTLSTSYILSEEQLVQCDPKSSGCNGGWPYWAFDYVKSAGGLSTESAYPYSSGNGITGSCKANKADFKVTVTGYQQIRAESDMGNYMVGTGPISVCVDASTWSSYKSGVMSARSCGKSINHAVQAVGVDTTAYWRIRNSWGTSWGENGFIRVEYGGNACGITSNAYVASVKLV